LVLGLAWQFCDQLFVTEYWSMSVAVLLDPLPPAGMQYLSLAIYNLPSRYLLIVNYNWVERIFEKFADQENIRKYSKFPRPGSFQEDDLVLIFEPLFGLRRVILFGVFSENLY
jgi:hypothetical protein